MSERLLKQWLQRFANDGDRAAIGSQWRAWTQHDPEAAGKAASWLVKVGLDDCRSAEHALTIFGQLFTTEGLGKEVVERSLSEYSEEDLEDLKLDNPKVADFVHALRRALDELASGRPAPTAPAGAGGAAQSAAAAGGAAVAEVNGCAEPRYVLEALLGARRALLRHGGCCLAEGDPRWRTEVASSLFAPLPQWAQRMAQGAATREAEASAGGGQEWRDAQRASAEARSKAGEDRGLLRRTQSKPHKEPLQVSSNSWVAQVRRMKEERQVLDEDGEQDERFVREMRATLNKLTVEKFDQLSEQIIGLISRSTRPNRGIPMLMQLVFEKATTQHHFISMYVNLCVKLHRWLTQNDRIVEMESQTNFKRILLNQCQSSFEQYLEPPDGFDGLKGDELYEAQVKYKTKMLGNIKLVGALIRHGMLAPKIAIAVATELSRDDPIVLEERLETLAVFLETVGPALDDPHWSHHGELEEIFAEVQRIVSHGPVASRIRFLLRDVLDLRRGKWQVQKVRDLDTDMPMTLAQVHQKAKQDQHAQHTPSSRDRREHQVGRPPLVRKWSANRPTSLGELDESPFVGGSEAMSSSAGDTARSAARPKAAAATTPVSAAARLAAAAASSPAATPPLMPRDRMLRAGVARDSQGSGRGPPGRGPGSAGHPQAPAAALTPSPPRTATPEPAEAATRAEPAPVAGPLQFQREVAQVIRQIGQGLDVAAAARRLRGCSLSSARSLEEAVDLIARVVDEPRQSRRTLFPLLPALVAEGVFVPAGVLRGAVESFVQDAFADLGSIDPPDLGDIVLRELLPALRLQPGDLRLPSCLTDLLD